MHAAAIIDTLGLFFIVLGLIIANGFVLEDGSFDNSIRDNLYIALFFELENVVIKDLTIDNLIIDVDTSLKDINNIIISPLSIIGNNVELYNFNISVTINYSKLPDKEIQIKVADGCFILDNDNLDELIKSGKLEVLYSNAGTQLLKVNKNKK